MILVACLAKLLKRQTDDKMQDPLNVRRKTASTCMPKYKFQG